MESRDYRHHRTLSNIQKCVQSEKDFLITTHINPDGDSLASVLIFAFLLKHLGKNYLILLDDEVPAKFNFLTGINEIKRFERKTYNFHPKVLVVVDSSSLERIGDVGKIVPQNIVIINIDHHPGNEEFGKFNLIDYNESSTVEIVKTILSLWKIPLSPDIATLLYTGIVCDTGRFLFPNTTHRSLSVCSEMMKKGAYTDRLSEYLYNRKTPATVKALAAALSTLEIHFEGSVSSIYLCNGKFSCDKKIDTEGFIDYLLMIEGTELAFFMLEKEPNIFRISFRSKKYIDVNEVAKAFGGGGHSRASGCHAEGTVDEVKEKILGVLKSYF